MGILRPTKHSSSTGAAGAPTAFVGRRPRWPGRDRDPKGPRAVGMHGGQGTHRVTHSGRGGRKHLAAQRVGTGRPAGRKDLRQSSGSGEYPLSMGLLQARDGAKPEKLARTAPPTAGFTQSSACGRAGSIPEGKESSASASRRWPRREPHPKRPGPPAAPGGRGGSPGAVRLFGLCVAHVVSLITKGSW